MTDAAGREDASAEVPVVLAEPHRRYNALTDEWVLVSAERTRRPWQGRRDHHAPAPLPSYDPSCYLCPGNTRANGEANPRYEETFVFTNDFAALRPDSAPARFEEGDLLRAEGERGTCRVLCFSPRHDLTLGRMTPEAVRRIIDLWAEHSAELGRTYRWVQVFENRGQAMGASSPHPHGQIWAGTALPVQAVREDATQLRWCDRTGQRLLLAYAAQEHGGPRVVVENEDWLVVVPFWAAWPFETLVLPRRPVSRLPDLGTRGTRHPGRHADRPAAPLRRALPRALPLLDGLAPGAQRRRPRRALAAPRALLSTAPQLVDAQVHGRLRAAGRGPARPEPGGRGVPTALPLSRRAETGVSDLIRLRAGDRRATVDVARGGRLASLTIADRELLVPAPDARRPLGSTGAAS